MQRIPEPKELMDEAEQALAYAEADFSASNELFVNLFLELCGHDFMGKVLDIGCGPADIPMRMLRHLSGLNIHALDGAEAMLAHAREALVQEPELMSRLDLECKLLPAADLPERHYDAVVSNSLLHHLTDPSDLWSTVRHCAKSEASVLIMDLKRPGNVEEVDS